MNDNNSNYDLKELILAQLDGSITKEQYQNLQQILNEDMDARKYYVEYMMLCSALKRYVKFPSVTGQEAQHTNIDNKFWTLMAEVEKTAPTLEIKDSQQKDFEVSKITQQKTTKKVSKTLLTTAVLSMAALIFLILYVQFVPIPKTVAVLEDAVDAQWLDTAKALQKGEMVFDTDDFRTLKSGIIKLEYEKAKVVLESPCEFACRKDNQIELRKGRIYVSVLPGNTGFVVDTPISRVTDLGTEFGVQVHSDGASEVHVIKGKASIATVVNKALKETKMILAGSAKYVDAKTKIIREIVFNREKFVNDIISEHNVIKRGRLYVDLAGITANGNGSKAGKTNIWLDPKQGYSEKSIHEHDTSDRYFPVSLNPFVDGLFVPGGQKDHQIISSERDVFLDCPQTSGVFYANIGVNPAPSFLEVSGMRDGIISFNNNTYGTPDYPCLVMHANIGITYDLRAIREKFPDWNLTHFVAKIGIANLNEPYPCNADFWVLVDGQIRYSLVRYKQKGNLIEIAVDIHNMDRFLSLAATDGGDKDILEVYKRAISCDWCVFAEPALEFE